jgi:uncharacterized protein (UPF0332 family)
MSDLWSKAQVAARSALVLLEKGDPDGAVNRAYYASFGAARAALASVRRSLAQSKRHNTIVRRFRRYVVEERGFDRSLSRAFFARQSHARWMADYGEDHVDAEAARAVIGDMERFLGAVDTFLQRPNKRSRPPNAKPTVPAP